MAIMITILKIYTEPKGLFTENLGGNIRVICRMKIAEIDPIENPSWPTDSKLSCKYRGKHRSKEAKIIPIRQPRWPPS